MSRINRVPEARKELQPDKTCVLHHSPPLGRRPLTDHPADGDHEVPIAGQHATGRSICCQIPPSIVPPDSHVELTVSWDLQRRLLRSVPHGGAIISSQFPTVVSQLRGSELLQDKWRQAIRPISKITEQIVSSEKSPDTITMTQ